jgi:hypothetical protein
MTHSLSVRPVGFEQGLQLAAEGDVRAGHEDSEITSTSSSRAMRAICSGRLAQAGVDDLEAGVHHGAGDDLGALVVAVEAGLPSNTLIGRVFGDPS